MNLGNFNSRQIELSTEFWLDESNHEAEYQKLQHKINVSLGLAEEEPNKEDQEAGTGSP